MELFETTGQVELAEILFEGTRSKGCGVVQFAQVQEAETAIGMHAAASPLCSSLTFAAAKFQQYMYGGRPLGMLTFRIHRSETILIQCFTDVRFNDRWHTFTPSAAKGGQTVPMQADGV